MQIIPSNWGCLSLDHLIRESFNPIHVKVIKIEEANTKCAKLTDEEGGALKIRGFCMAPPIPTKYSVWGQKQRISDK